MWTIQKFANEKCMFGKVVYKINILQNRIELVDLKKCIFGLINILSINYIIFYVFIKVQEWVY